MQYVVINIYKQQNVKVKVQYHYHTKQESLFIYYLLWFIMINDF